MTSSLVILILHNISLSLSVNTRAAERKDDASSLYIKIKYAEEKIIVNADTQFWAYFLTDEGSKWPSITRDYCSVQTEDAHDTCYLEALFIFQKMTGVTFSAAFGADICRYTVYDFYRRGLYDHLVMQILKFL